ncbi:AraC-like ligand-binding domain-containing protein [Micromonospora zhanjiangensis]|uniref:Helix-turn-helix domain-containing protein n=1 Tax=Micromonospora zhanjiangensis TaxID=1522057 RepID=A0ABV8KQU0_9ACTN
MIYVDSRSDDLPAAERLTWWHDRTRELIVPTVIECDDVANFRASARLVDLAGIHLSRLDYRSIRYRRSPKLVRQSDPEQLVLALTLRGQLNLEVTRRQTVLGVRNFVLYDTSHPFHGWTADDGETASQLLLQIPRTRLPLPARTTDRLIAERICAGDGVGALVATTLTEITRRAPAYRPTDVPRLATIVVDLVTALFAHQLDARASVPTESHRQVLLARVQAFIERRLGDPDLSPGMVAAAHGVSLRHLQLLFQAEGDTVAGWIRHRRLEHCRRALAEPLLVDRSIRALAARWGFPDAAHFSRAFRAAYGIPPRDYRRERAVRE